MSKTIEDVAAIVKKFGQKLAPLSEKAIKESHLQIGTAILDELYGGDILALRDKGKKSTTLRDLQKISGVPIARMSRCVAATWAYRHIDPSHQKLPTTSQLVLLGKAESGLDGDGIREVSGAIYAKTDTPKWDHFGTAVDSYKAGGKVWDAFKALDKFPSTSVPLVQPPSTIDPASMMVDVVPKYTVDLVDIVDQSTSEVDMLTRSSPQPSGAWDLPTFQALVFADRAEIKTVLCDLSTLELANLADQLSDMIKLIAETKKEQAKPTKATAKTKAVGRPCKAHADRVHHFEPSPDDDMHICLCGFKGPVPTP
jgi:hypothetical protein